MKPGMLIALFLVSVLVCNAGQPTIVCTTDGTALVLGQTTTAVKFENKPVALAGANSVIAAMQLYDHAIRKGILISEIDISPTNYLDATLVGGIHCRINWQGMGKGTSLSSQDLDGRLDRLFALLKISRANKAPTRYIDILDSPPDHTLPPPARLIDARSAKTNPDSHPQFSLYTVNENENLSSIAEMFETSVDELKKANKLGKSGQVVPGQKILIPIK